MHMYGDVDGNQVEFRDDLQNVMHKLWDWGVQQAELVMESGRYISLERMDGGFKVEGDGPSITFLKHYDRWITKEVS